jgi:hypothetical protein
MAIPFVRLGVCAAAAISLAGCESAKSANPLSPTVAGPIPGVSITAPKPLEPGAGSQVHADKQPITLIVENATSNGVRPLSYLFEVSSDSGFQTVLYTRDGISPGDGGRTSLRLSDPLATGRTYYWRARAQDGANTGPYSAAVGFTVLQPVVIEAPVLSSPVGGVTVSTNPPTLVFRNSTRTGPAGDVTYTVQVSKNEAFTDLAYQERAAEQTGDTRVTPSTLEDSTRFYWRVRASNGTVQSDWSETATFLTPADAPAPPPPPPPPSGGGGGGSGGSCASTNGDFIVQCIAAKYPRYLRAGVSASTRRSNMEFLRNRIIEAGICGGLDLGWNMKRGGPEKSIDFIAERRGGQVYGYDIARDYDNTSTELQLAWQEDGPGSHWGGYSPRPSCD